MHHVVARGETRACVVVAAPQRKIVEMPVGILSVVSDILQECIRVRVGIGFADPVLDFVRPICDTGQRFSRLENLPQPNAEVNEERARKRLMSSAVSFFMSIPFLATASHGRSLWECNLRGRN